MCNCMPKLRYKIIITYFPSSAILLEDGGWGIKNNKFETGKNIKRSLIIICKVKHELPKKLQAFVELLFQTRDYASGNLLLQSSLVTKFEKFKLFLLLNTFNSRSFSHAESKIPILNQWCHLLSQFPNLVWWILTKKFTQLCQLIL